MSTERNAAPASPWGERPEPLVIPPRSGKHETSFVLLHGRGSNGESFGDHLLRWEIPGFDNLALAFPNAKFIFPTTLMRRAAVFQRMKVPQWFDIWSLVDPDEREELQYEGLKESTGYVHQLLKEEISAVGARNVILGGLSQGWATSMVALLLWDGEPLGAAIGMCGWLPLQGRLQGVLRDDAEGGEDDDNPFAKDRPVDSTSSERAGSKVSYVVEYLREVLEMPSTASCPAESIPFFAGHGSEDEKVAVKLGRDAAVLLRGIGIDVEYTEYEGLHHWYSSNMLRDIVRFIEAKTEWKVVK